MALRKYQSVEKVEVLPPREQQRIAGNLNKVGKKSATELTDEERRRALDSK